MFAPKRLKYPSAPWPYPEGLLIPWSKPAPMAAAAMVKNATLLFAASLNLSKLVNGPELVARSGKTLDLSCSRRTTETLLCKAPVGGVCDCGLGASGGGVV